MTHAIITLSECPLPGHAHLVAHDVRQVHVHREEIRAAIRSAKFPPLRLSMSPAIFQRFANLEGQPGLVVVRGAA